MMHIRLANIINAYAESPSIIDTRPDFFHHRLDPLYTSILRSYRVFDSDIVIPIDVAKYKIFHSITDGVHFCVNNLTDNQSWTSSYVSIFNELGQYASRAFVPSGGHRLKLVSDLSILYISYIIQEYNSLFYSQGNSSISMYAHAHSFTTQRNLESRIHIPNRFESFVGGIFINPQFLNEFNEAYLSFMNEEHDSTNWIECIDGIFNSKWFVYVTDSVLDSDNTRYKGIRRALRKEVKDSGLETVKLPMDDLFIRLGEDFDRDLIESRVDTFINSVFLSITPTPIDTEVITEVPFEPDEDVEDVPPPVGSELEELMRVMGITNLTSSHSENLEAPPQSVRRRRQGVSLERGETQVIVENGYFINDSVDTINEARFIVDRAILPDDATPLQSLEDLYNSEIEAIAPYFNSTDT